MSTVILTAATGAGQSRKFPVRGVQRAGGAHAHLTAPGLATTETATVQKEDSAGSFSDYYVNGVIQQITPTNSGVVIDAAGYYRINKSETAGAVAVEISTPDHP
jgi:hypothetical protein